MTDTNRVKTVLFDIDGTLANIEHRRTYLAPPKPNWGAFNGAMGHDTPNEPIVALYKTLWRTVDYAPILVTGRNEKFRQVTEQWLAWNEIPFDRLLMRADKDSRADHVIKEEILDRLLAEGLNIVFTVDDRQQVVDMWRRRGIVCLQCDVGDF
ncbi:HAD family acid phosphatase [uncultured Erythrobacter sp.]|uniref:phosphatase domain-containing protein n=1 Tax=uncultured Erythrobacter sp. TaxID=263913 RepID=UPI00260297C4|nr:HAD family acid phosphatase [uncultured Erythrobacter sp.]